MLKNQKGQALLIIVLVMVVALTIGLSVASRTITNLRNTREQVGSQKALSAAEAGVEQTIRNNASVSNGSFADNTKYTTTITQAGSQATSFLLNGGNAVPKNDAIYVWLDADATMSASLWPVPPSPTWSGNLSVYWGTDASCNNAAIEVVIISGSAASPIATRYIYDSNAARQAVNHFSSPSVAGNALKATISGIKLYCQTDIAGVTNGLLARINPYYNATFIGVLGSNQLPSQGRIITSIGTSPDSTQRKVTVYQGYPEIPAEFFPFILFSP